MSEKNPDGEAPVVVFGGDHWWGPVADGLRGRDAVVFFDPEEAGLFGTPGLVSLGEIVAAMRPVVAGLRAPAVMVGHSFGGAVAQAYARTHPEDVAALVLVDSMHADQMERFSAFDPAAGAALKADLAESLPDVDWPACAAVLRALPPLPATVGLTVISRGQPTDVGPVWAELQADLVALHAGGRQIIATQSGHAIQFDEPEVVLAAITANI